MAPIIRGARTQGVRRADEVGPIEVRGVRGWRGRGAID